MDKEKANYIVKYFSQFLSENENLAMLHYASTQKLSENTNSALLKMYEEKGWLSKDEKVIDLLSKGLNISK